MRKRKFLLTLLTVMMVVSFAVPLVSVLAEPTNTTDKTLTVEIFNGDINAVTLGGGATAGTDDGVAIVSMTDTTAWPGGQILFKEPKDLSAAKSGQLCIEYKNADSLTWHWTTVGVALKESWGTSTASLNGNGADLGVQAAYGVKKFDLSVLKDAELAKFYGLTITTSGNQTGANFTVKRVWVGYPNPDYVEEPTTEGVYKLVTEPVTSAQDSTYQFAVTVPSSYTVKSGDKIKAAYTLQPFTTSGKSIDVSIGGVAVDKGIWATTQTGTWEYTFDKEFSGDIRFGVWSTSFTIDYLELTIYSSGTETKKVNFYDESGNVITDLSSVEYDKAAENVLPEYSVEGKIFIGWKIGEGLYPAGGKFDAKTTDSVTAVAIDFKTNSGAYFRIGENAEYSGIRFHTSFNAADYEKIKSFVTEYGTLILPEDTLNGKEITLENFVADETVLKVKSTSSSVDNGTTTFRGAIFSVKEANYNRTFAGRGYLTVKYSDETVKNFYSETIAKNSVASMAKSFIENNSEEFALLTEEQKAVVNAYAAAYQA